MASWGPGRLGGQSHLITEVSLTLTSAQVALDVVEEICAEMALTRPEAFNEYVIFIVTNQGKWPGRLSMLGLRLPPSL